MEDIFAEAEKKDFDVMKNYYKILGCKVCKGVFVKSKSIIKQIWAIIKIEDDACLFCLRKN